MASDLQSKVNFLFSLFIKNKTNLCRKLVYEQEKAWARAQVNQIEEQRVIEPQMHSVNPSPKSRTECT